MNSFIIIIILLFFVFSAVNTVEGLSSGRLEMVEPEVEEEEEEYEFNYLPVIVEYIPVTNIEELEARIEFCKMVIEALEEYVLQFTTCDDAHLLTELVAQIQQNQREILVTLSSYEQLKQWLEEYPIATEIWLYLQNECHFNKYVSAGIMGNLMAETGIGENKLTLRPELVYQPAGENAYGICQWRQIYYPQLYGSSLEFQLDFLKNSMQKIIETFSERYSSSLTYEEFIATDDVDKATEIFAICYERCSTKNLHLRKEYAAIALAYFCPER